MPSLGEGTLSPYRLRKGVVSHLRNLSNHSSDRKAAPLPGAVFLRPYPKNLLPSPSPAQLLPSQAPHNSSPDLRSPPKTPPRLRGGGRQAGGVPCANLLILHTIRVHLSRDLPSPKGLHMKVPLRASGGTLLCGLPQFSGLARTTIRPGRISMAYMCAKLSEIHPNFGDLSVSSRTGRA